MLVCSCPVLSVTGILILTLSLKKNANGSFKSIFFLVNVKHAVSNFKSRTVLFIDSVLPFVAVREFYEILPGRIRPHVLELLTALYPSIDPNEMPHLRRGRQCPFHAS